MPSMFDASIPVFIRALSTLSHELDKAEVMAAERGLLPESLIEARLIEDMFPLRKQVQIASDTAKGCAMRLAGRENPTFEDNEVSFADLQARIAKTIALLQSVDAAALADSDTRQINLNLGRQQATFEGEAYLLSFALPNFFFHVTTAYAILRHKGVPIGKRDFLGALPVIQAAA
jgi:uncharacterized protein